MDHHTHRLVHHNHIVILIDHIQRNILRQGLGLLRFRQTHRNRLPAGKLQAFGGDLPVHRHLALGNETLGR